jgi:hypothetical protein
MTDDTTIDDIVAIAVNKKGNVMQISPRESKHKRAGTHHAHPTLKRRDLTLAPSLRSALRDLAAVEGIGLNTSVTLLIREGLDRRLHHGGR